MENASKALIIAGAILLSILIIALGMRIYNSASSSAEGADLSAQELSAHNSQFEAYTGRQKGSQVVTLINAIQKNNEDYEDRTISVSFSFTKKRFGKVNQGINIEHNLTNLNVLARVSDNGTDDANNVSCVKAGDNKSYEAAKNECKDVYKHIRDNISPNATYEVAPYYYNSLITGFEIRLQP